MIEKGKVFLGHRVGVLFTSTSISFGFCFLSTLLLSETKIESSFHVFRLIGDGEVIFLLCFFLHFHERSDRKILKSGGKIRNMFAREVSFNRRRVWTYCRFTFDYFCLFYLLIIATKKRLYFLGLAKIDQN
jgi:hypothetical protein